MPTRTHLVLASPFAFPPCARLSPPAAPLSPRGPLLCGQLCRQLVGPAPVDQVQPLACRGLCRVNVRKEALVPLKGDPGAADGLRVVRDGMHCLPVHPSAAGHAAKAELKVGKRRPKGGRVTDFGACQLLIDCAGAVDVTEVLGFHACLGTDMPGTQSPTSRGARQGLVGAGQRRARYTALGHHLLPSAWRHARGAKVLT